MSKFKYSELKDNRLEFIKNTGVHIKIPIMWSGGLSLSEEKAVGKAMSETFDGYLEQGTRDAVNLDTSDMDPKEQQSFLTKMKTLRTERLAICKKCENYKKHIYQCKLCGCVMPLKASIKFFHCPIDKW